MKALSRGLGLLATLLTAGCLQSEVIDQSGSGGASPGDLENGGGGAELVDPVEPRDPGPFYTAVAMTRAQLDALWEEYWSDQPSGTTVGSGGGGQLNPNDLFLRVADVGVSCNSPTVQLPCGGHWSVSIALPPKFQAVGTYSLDEPEIFSYSGIFESGERYSPSPDDCAMGGGSIPSGTIQILAIDEHEVQFVLAMQPAGFWVDPSGTYTAHRCD